MTYILIRNYVTKDNPYSNGFVHSRVKAYIKNGVGACVFVINPDSEFSSYEIDNVKVYCGDKNDFSKLVSDEPNPTVCVHFLDEVIIDCLEQLENLKKVFIFVHGYEALYWYQRIFPGTFTNIKALWNFIFYIKSNIVGITAIRKFLARTDLDCNFIAVSDWMKNQAESVWKCKDKYTWHIIPNYIDSSLFSYSQKTPADNLRLLSIRPFSTGKYANDITAKFICKLNANGKFENVNITWAGSGILYNMITKNVKNFNNVHLINKLFTQSEVAKFHKSDGIFICPTRQDAQGGVNV